MQAETSARLSAFAGASSISSAQYFGEEDPVRRSGGSGSDWDGIQGAAADFARKFVGQAAADVGALKNVVQSGTSKVGVGAEFGRSLVLLYFTCPGVRDRLCQVVAHVVE